MPPLDPKTQRRRVRLGDTVRALRQERGWTQEELAHRTGFDRKSINRLETAAYSPTVDRLHVVADALGVTIASLLEEPARSRRGAARDG